MGNIPTTKITQKFKRERIFFVFIRQRVEGNSVSAVKI
jgi:hypothetical protein